MNGANHLTNSISTYPFAVFGHDWKIAMEGKSYPTKGDTIIENDVWIGYGSTIMPGVRIGNGSIIAAKSTVTKDVEPYSIIGGNPGKLIRKRFDDSQISKLLEINWWNWDIERITKNVKYLTSCELDKLV